jgi:hypothetical protein
MKLLFLLLVISLFQGCTCNKIKDAEVIIKDAETIVDDIEKMESDLKDTPKEVAKV